jgi:hypothetical protein
MGLLISINTLKSISSFGKAHMRRNKQNKIQELVVKQLMETGYLSLTLPGGMKVELGTLQEGREGDLVKVDDYAWLIASQNERTVSIDSYNFGLKYKNKSDKILFDDLYCDNEGEMSRRLFVA